jgi:hypothetical protein
MHACCGGVITSPPLFERAVRHTENPSSGGVLLPAQVQASCHCGDRDDEKTPSTTHISEHGTRRGPSRRIRFIITASGGSPPLRAGKLLDFVDKQNRAGRKITPLDRVWPRRCAFDRKHRMLQRARLSRTAWKLPRHARWMNLTHTEAACPLVPKSRCHSAAWELGFLSAWRQRELWKIRIHVVPRLSAGYVEVQAGLERGRIVQ